MSDLELIVVGGIVIGAAYEAMGPGSAPMPASTPYTSTPTSGSTTGDQLGDNAAGSAGGVTAIGPPTANLLTQRLNMGYNMQAISSGGYAGVSSSGIGAALYGAAGGSSLGAGVDPDTQAKIDQVNSACSDFWSQASDAAKMQAAAQLNTQFQLNPPLTGHESWTEISERCGQAAGKLGGQAIGGAIAGPAGTYIGGMCGSMLGGKVSDWIGANSQGVYDWCKDKLKGLGCDIGDLGQEVWDNTLGAIF